MPDWNLLQNILVFGGGVILLLETFAIVKRWRQGYWKLGFKETSKSIVLIGGFVWLMYAIVFLAGTVAEVADWSEVLVASAVDLSEESLWIMNSLPMFYTISIALFIIWLSGKIFSYKPKYSDEEKALLEEEKAKVKKKWGWFGRFIK